MQVARGDLRLHLTEHYGDGTPGTHVFLPMAGIDAFQAELRSHRSRFSWAGLQTNPWGRTLTVIDPFANQLNFTEWTADSR